MGELHMYFKKWERNAYSLENERWQASLVYMIKAGYLTFSCISCLQKMWPTKQPCAAPQHFLKNNQSTATKHDASQEGSTATLPHLPRKKCFEPLNQLFTESMHQLFLWDPHNYF